VVTVQRRRRKEHAQMTYSPPVVPHHYLGKIEEAW
jgi:hypothetical protein